MRTKNEAIRLSAYLAMAPAKTAAEESKPKKRKVDAGFEEALDDMPWLKHLEQKEWDTSSWLAEPAAAAASSETGRSGQFEDYEEDVALGALASLDAERSAIAAATGSKL